MEKYGRNFRAPKVDIHKFSMIPRSEIPRSRFRMQTQHKTTFSASQLIPVFLQEVLPGDSFKLSMSAFVRMSTPVFPLMDNMDLESWFFFVPCRLVWSHWVNFMGEQPASPSDSISYTVPVVNSPAGGFLAFGLYDYFGIPTSGQIAGGSVTTTNALPCRAYNMIWNQWFRDENLQPAQGYGAANTVYDLGDGPDPYTNYSVQNVQKRHDYFTSCLPWTQKGASGPVTLPLSGFANVKTSGSALVTGTQNPLTFLLTTGANPTASQVYTSTAAQGLATASGPAISGQSATAVYPSNLYADLSTATAATINQLRLAFQTQKLLERDARGGTRYTEVIRSHFGVLSPDMRLQRPEYLGGGRTPVNMAPVPQTTATGLTGGTSPLGTLAGVGTAVMRQHGFRQSFTEHGYVLGLVSVRRDQVYQQGLRRLWTRSTRYDFYWPVFAMLGEQGVRNDEIYCQGSAGGGFDAAIFGYQERWAEYRYFPSMVTGAFRSTYATPLDSWHLATKFTSLPGLSNGFLQDDTQSVLVRCLAAGSNANFEQFLCDFFFDMECARPMPMYSVPGLIDHF